MANDIYTFKMRIGRRKGETDREDELLFAMGRLSELLGIGARFECLTR